MNTILRSLGATALAAAALAACRSNRDSRGTAPGDTAAATTTAGSLEGPTRRDSGAATGGMASMSDMGGMMGAGMMDSMQTHMRMMDTTSADRMKAMLPTHRQMVANMLSQMSQEMRGMKMPADPAWNALADSVRQDLVQMPEMSGRELGAMMPAHYARMTRLMRMHSDMTGRMKS